MNKQRSAMAISTPIPDPTAAASATSPHLASTAFTIAIIGGGPAGLMAAEVLAAGGAQVDLYDAMPSVGSDADEFMLQGRHILVRNGACTDDAGTLAGSNLDMITAVHNSVAMLDVPIERAIAMASAAPATFLGLAAETGRIAPGLRADLLQLDAQGAVVRSWIGGSY